MPRTHTELGLIAYNEVRGKEPYGATQKCIDADMNRPPAISDQKYAEQAREAHAKLVAARDAFPAAEKAHAAKLAKLEDDKVVAWQKREHAVAAAEKHIAERERHVATREAALKEKEDHHRRRVAAYESAT